MRILRKSHKKTRETSTKNSTSLCFHLVFATVVMAPTALALGLLWSAAADVVLGPRTRNGASLVNIAKLPLHTKGTSILVDDHWVVD